MGKSKGSIKQFGVYTHARPNGIVFYVGKGDMERSKYPWRNIFHDRIVVKYGWKNIRIKFYKCVSEETAYEREIKLILYYRNKGIKLANFTDGGDGVRLTPEMEKKRIAAIKKAWESKETKQKRAASMKIAQATPEYKKKFGRSIRKRWKDPEFKKKMSCAIKKGLATDSYRKKKTKIMKDLWKNPEYRKNLEQKAKNKIFTEEHKRNISLSKRTPEAREKLQQQMKDRWKDPEYRKRTLAILRNASKKKSVKDCEDNNRSI